MHTNARGIQIIKDSESLALEAYLCPAGKWTIGWGHTSGVYQGMKCTEQQAEDYLQHDLQYAERIITDNVKTTLNENQFSALASFVFNVGYGKKDVKSGFVKLRNGEPSTILRKLNAGDYAGAANQFNLWVYANNNVLFDGLIIRRQKEKELFLSIV